MTDMIDLPHLSSLGLKVVAAVGKRVITDLKRDTHSLTSGDSGLKTVWEEYCVQLQYQQSFAWEAFEYHVERLINGYLCERKTLEIEAAGFYVFEAELSEVEDFDSASSIESIVAFIRCEYVDPAGEDYSNSRIRKYLEGDDSY